VRSDPGFDSAVGAIANMQRRRAMAGAAACLVGLALPAGAQTPAVDPAVASIRAFYVVLLDVMKQAEKLGVRGRYDKLAPAIRSTYDLPMMTRIAVGPDWSKIPPEQQAALVDAFERRTIATYANRFDGYSGQSFEVDPEVETRNTGRLVRSKLLRPPEIPVTLNYLMRASGDTWKIVDVYLAGLISEMASQRTEFRGILDKGGPAALIKNLNQQVDKLLHKV
jgi:phospholipid transport system substrate-binding protein